MNSPFPFVKIVALCSLGWSLIIAVQSSAEQIGSVLVTIEMEGPDPEYRGAPKSWDKPAGESVSLEVLYGNRIIGSRDVGSGETWRAKTAGDEATDKKHALRRKSLHYLGFLGIAAIYDQIKHEFKSIESITRPQDWIPAKSHWNSIQRLEAALQEHQNNLRNYELQDPDRPDIAYLRDRAKFIDAGLSYSNALRLQTITTLNDRLGNLARDDPSSSVLQDAVALLQESKPPVVVAAAAHELPLPPSAAVLDSGLSSAHGINFARLARQADSLTQAIAKHERTVQSIAEKATEKTDADQAKTTRDIRSYIDRAVSQAGNSDPAYASGAPIRSQPQGVLADSRVREEVDQAASEAVEIKTGIEEYVHSMQQVLDRIRDRLRSFRQSVDSTLDENTLAVEGDPHDRRLRYVDQFIEKVEQEWRLDDGDAPPSDTIDRFETSELPANERMLYHVLFVTMNAQESSLLADEYRHQFAIPLRTPIPDWNTDNAHVRVSSPYAEGWRFRVSVVGSLDDPRAAKAIPAPSNAKQDDEEDASLDAAKAASWNKAELLTPVMAVSMGGELAFQPPGRERPDGNPQKQHRHQTEHMWRFQRLQ